jgi:hypothetical protein
MFYWPNKHNQGKIVFKQTHATFMFQCHVSHVSFQGYTYITCDNECNMMLLHMICNANACLTPRVLQVITRSSIEGLNQYKSTVSAFTVEF